MKIGDAAERAGLPPKTVRYYEDIKLLRPARAANGYRSYDESDVHRLAFIQRARGLGFTIDECRLLLSLYNDKDRASADVKAVALRKIAEIDRKLLELHSLKSTLKTLAETCHGDERPDCPIIDEIAKGPVN